LPPLPVPGGADPVALPIIVYKSGKCTWSINGGIAGDYGSFTTDNGRLAITYKAPASIPTSHNPVAISADIDLGGMKYNGKKYNKTELVSYVKIGNPSFDIVVDVEVDGTSTKYDDDYHDGATFEVDVEDDGITVDIPIAVNRAPTVIPPTSPGGGTVWIPDGVGLTNIVGAKLGVVIGGDSIALLFNHERTVTPKWSVTDNTGSYTFGGDPVPGLPGALTFAMKDEVQHVGEVNYTMGKVIVNYTITPMAN